MNAKSTAASVTAENGSAGSNAHQAASKAMIRSKDRLMLDLKTVVDDAQALLNEVAESSTESIANVPVYLEKRLDMVKDSLDRVRTALEKQAKHAAVVTDKYVKKNPWKSMGFASAATLLVSVLLVSAWGPAFGRTGESGK